VAWLKAGPIAVGHKPERGGAGCFQIQKYHLNNSIFHLFKTLTFTQKVK
jgi:hypothetical protein